jgi:hypothetical protein
MRRLWFGLLLFSIATLGEFTALFYWRVTLPINFFLSVGILWAGFVVERGAVVAWLDLPAQVCDPFGRPRRLWSILFGVTLTEIVIWVCWWNLSHRFGLISGAIFLAIMIHAVHSYEIAVVGRTTIFQSFRAPGTITLSVIESLGGACWLYFTDSGKPKWGAIVLFISLLVEHILQVLGQRGVPGYSGYSGTDEDYPKGNTQSAKTTPSQAAMFTIVDVVLEVNPDSLSLLQKRVLDLAQKEDPGIKGVPSFARLQQIKQLHFMSMQIFDDPHFDPLLVFENNFDGDSDSYWNSVVQEIGDDLRDIFACTKAAVDPLWSHLFTAGSHDALVQFIKTFSVLPSASHIGAVGVPVERVKRDKAVFEALQIELGVANKKYSTLGAVPMHDALRKWAVNGYAWLAVPESLTIPKQRQIYRFANLKPFMPSAILILGTMLVVLVGIGWLFASYILTPHRPSELRDILAVVVIVSIVGLMGVLVMFGLWFWTTLRRLENTDFTQASPTLDPNQLSAFASQEDQIVQNHLASMVLVKPGAVRSIVIHTSLFILHLYVPFKNYDGYLGAMRTIHFAHWTLIGNGGRLLFLSNFDGSWQSYLDDFVDKAATGLTLAWGNCVGFPPTKDLVVGGAAHGHEFKAWARESQTLNLLWYSAYKDLTVNQILRNAAIVDGLRKIDMTEVEAREWAALL